MVEALSGSCSTRGPSVGAQALAALRRMQDQDWESWDPKQREKARQNGEFYGEDRLKLFETKGKD